MTEPKFTVVIPCYNEEQGVERTIRSLKQNLRNNYTYEVVVVDDGSTDRTADVVREISERCAEVRLVKHRQNLGYGAALKTGIRSASGEIVVITDADGTYPSEQIAELMVRMGDADMVVGARTGSDVVYPSSRKLAKFVLQRYVSWIAGEPVPDMNSGLRAFRRSLVDRFLKILPDGFSFTTTLTIALVVNRYRVVYVPINYASRLGKSKIRPIRDTLNIIQLILRTGMYFAPLRLLSPLIIAVCVAFMLSLTFDIFVLRDLTEKTLLLLMISLNISMFALLADMIDKRTR